LRAREPLELSVHDIVAARVPPELVYIILGLAEYWARIKFTHAQAVQLSASRSANADASLC
jgi:hypothetical protein